MNVSAECSAALQQWRNPAGVSLGMVASRVVITTDASMSGWGATFKGRAVNGVWSAELAQEHINYLELMAVFLALKHFLPHLRELHVLVKSDNSTVVAYVNRQGSTRSLWIHKQARKIILWSVAQVASGDACSGSAEQGRRSHVKRKPPVRGMETPSPGGEPAVADIRPGCRRSVRLVRKCALSDVFLINRGGCTFRYRGAVAPIAKRPTVRISSSQSYLPHTDQSERSGLVAGFDSPSPHVDLSVKDRRCVIGASVMVSPEAIPIVTHLTLL